MGCKGDSFTMMEVLITFPLREGIDFTILEEFMLIIYQPRDMYDDWFDKVGEYEDDYSNKPLLFTQKSATNHVILDGIHEISFHLKLPKGPYIYLHKQKDRLLINENGLVTTLGNGRSVNYITEDGGDLTFVGSLEEAIPLQTSPNKTNDKESNDIDPFEESNDVDSFEEYKTKQIITETTPIQRDTISRILNDIGDCVKNSGEDKAGECVKAMK